MHGPVFHIRPALIVVGVLVATAFVASVVCLAREKTAGAFLQLLGAGCLVVVVLAHIGEELRLLPGMGWGLSDSLGHYVDLVSAAGGLTLLPLGYLLRRVPNERHSG